MRASEIESFERIARDAEQYAVPADPVFSDVHPFELRNIHPDLPKRVRSLFDDGYFAEATFHAFKWVDKEVRRISKSNKYGFRLMMDVFAGDPPAVQLNALSDQSETDEQDGYKFIFAGSQSAIRNPRGHELETEDTPDECLDYLALASLLIRRLDAAGLRDDQ